jgi:hypothetical protein
MRPTFAGLANAALVREVDQYLFRISNFSQRMVVIIPLPKMIDPPCPRTTICEHQATSKALFKTPGNLVGYGSVADRATRGLTPLESGDLKDNWNVRVL